MPCREKTEGEVCGRKAYFQVEGKEWVCEDHIFDRRIIINMNEVLAEAWEGCEPYSSDDF